MPTTDPAADHHTHLAGLRKRAAALGLELAHAEFGGADADEYFGSDVNVLALSIPEALAPWPPAEGS